MEGIITGLPRRKGAHVLEIKTHNKSNFNAVQKHGVAKSKPTHYAQVQITMKLQNINQCLYLAVCKDDERMYCEIIEADQAEQDKLFKRIKSLTEATMRPAGISDLKRYVSKIKSHCVTAEHVTCVNPMKTVSGCVH